MESTDFLNATVVANFGTVQGEMTESIRQIIQNARPIWTGRNCPWPAVNKQEVVNKFLCVVHNNIQVHVIHNFTWLL